MGLESSWLKNLGLKLGVEKSGVEMSFNQFEDMLDHATTLAEHDINDVDCELKLDFRVLIPNQSKGI